MLKTRNRRYSELPSEIDSLNPDYILELHLNAANKKSQGSEVLYCRASSRGKKMAEVIQNNLVKRLNLVDRGALRSDKGGIREKAIDGLKKIPDEELLKGVIKK